MTLILAYDDSPDARTALEAAGAMHPGWEALIVHAWEPPVVPGDSPMLSISEVGDAAEVERRAEEVAADGARRAVAAGLRAEQVTRRGAGAEDIAAALLTVAEEHRAELIVVGRRGLGRLRSTVLGSVSDALVREAPLPVLVVPGQE